MQHITTSHINEQISVNISHFSWKCNNLGVTRVSFGSRASAPSVTSELCMLLCDSDTITFPMPTLAEKSKIMLLFLTCYSSGPAQAVKTLDLNIGLIPSKNVIICVTSQKYLWRCAVHCWITGENNSIFFFILTFASQINIQSSQRSKVGPRDLLYLIALDRSVVVAGSLLHLYIHTADLYNTFPVEIWGLSQLDSSKYRTQVVKTRTK